MDIKTKDDSLVLVSVVKNFLFEGHGTTSEILKYFREKGSAIS